MRRWLALWGRQVKTDGLDSLAQELVAQGRFYLPCCSVQWGGPRALGHRLGSAHRHSRRPPLAVSRRSELEGAGRRAEVARGLGQQGVQEPALAERLGPPFEARLTPSLL